MIGLGMSCAVVAAWAGGKLPAVGDPTIISSTTWAVLIVVTGGLMLSFTKVRRLETVGASNLGYTALYLLLAGIGAQADLKAVLDTPLYLAAGAVWILIHIGVLLLAARIVRAPSSSSRPVAWPTSAGRFRRRSSRGCTTARWRRSGCSWLWRDTSWGSTGRWRARRSWGGWGMRPGGPAR